MDKDGLTITKTAEGKLTRLPYVQMKNAVLGKKSEVSLVFISPRKSRALNKKYRGKNEPASVLTFPLSKTEGEIFIDAGTAKRKALDFEMKPSQFIGYLFIHGLLHLKGLRHGKKMEREEEKVRLNLKSKRVLT